VSDDPATIDGRMVDRANQTSLSPLRTEMQAIMEGSASLPDASAGRHHFVPAFALAQFARPAARKGWLTQLDVRSGTPQKTRPNDASFETGLYMYENTAGEQSATVEAFFSIVEKHAAPALRQLRECPAEITAHEREAISYFLAFQESRTPAGLARSEHIRQATMEVQAALDVGTAAAFEESIGRHLQDGQSPAEREALRLRMQAELLEGRVSYETPRAGALKLIIEGAHEIARTIFSLDWTVITADESEFITSDHPISMVDTSPEHPWSGNAWKSSPGAVSFYPLSPSKGLFLRPGDCGLSTGHADASQVRRFNLMTYGWAQRHVFGTSQEVLTRVRRQARQFPRDVVRRRSNKIVVLVPADRHDPSVTVEYARRGWPTEFVAEDPTGRPRKMSYVIVDMDEPRGAAARAATQIVEGFLSAT
jgi:hypothetical protein